MRDVLRKCRCALIVAVRRSDQSEASNGANAAAERAKTYAARRGVMPRPARPCVTRASYLRSPRAWQSAPAISLRPVHNVHLASIAPPQNVRQAPVLETRSIAVCQQGATQCTLVVFGSALLDQCNWKLEIRDVLRVIAAFCSCCRHPFHESPGLCSCA